MTRINTNVAALVGSRNLNTNNTALNTTLQRLSTGYRINSGKDDPAGLIASETLRSDMAAIQSALKNNERANSIISTAEGALAEVSDLLITLQELTGEAANAGGLTKEEIDANQLQVDGIIESINRIANQTTFEGKRLLDGSMGFQTSAVSNTSKIQDLKVNAAKAEDSTLSAVLSVVRAASQAVNATEFSALSGDMTVQITGKKGSETFFFASGATSAQITAAVNAASAITGVYVSTDYKLRSTDYGADAFVRVELISGTESNLKVESDTGADAIISIDGQKASVDNYKVALRTNTMDISFKVTDALIDTAGNSESIAIKTGGGAKFQINQKIDETGQVILGIPSITAPHLGSVENGFLSDISGGSAYDLDSDPEGAAAIVSDAITQISTLRGRLGSFLKDTVSTTINSLNVAYENVAAADAVIRETDFATETAALTRNQILVNASTSVLSIANSSPQAVLALIG